MSTSPSAQFLDLPGEILSQIASYLPINQLLPYLSIHPKLLSLTQSHLSPFPRLIDDLLDAGPPYPHLLTVLPTLRSFLPHDDGRLFLNVLVRARPRWLLERMEMGHWPQDIWKVAFERRFLPSWKEFKRVDDSWRAIFLRMLGRLEHRNLGCTHEESWTKFVTIHRNGSAGINRYYSRHFDPYVIYDELKSQNNFASHPTQVRVVLHLQDVRILAVGVLSSEPTLFVNPNAHLLLHPPLLRDTTTQIETPPPTPNWYTPSASRPVVSFNEMVSSNEAYFPLVRTLSPSTPGSTSYGLGEGYMIPRSSGPSSPSLASTIAGMIPGRRRRNTEETGRNLLSQVRSRDREIPEETRRRSWAFGRNRTGSTSNALTVGSVPAEQGTVSPGPAMPSVVEQASSIHADIPEIPPHGTDQQEQTESISTGTDAKPYPILRKPLPALGFANYPNYTPKTDYDGPMRDTRYLYPEIEDNAIGQSWADEVPTHKDDIRLVEWSQARARRERWVGPMILVAQLYPAARVARDRPADGPTEGPTPDLGPQGMYASLAFEDIAALLPWVEFKGGGAHHAEAMRSGLGFE